MAIGQIVLALGLVLPMAQAQGPTPAPTPTPTPTPSPSPAKCTGTPCPSYYPICAYKQSCTVKGASAPWKLATSSAQDPKTGGFNYIEKVCTGDYSASISITKGPSTTTAKSTSTEAPPLTSSTAAPTVTSAPTTTTTTGPVLISGSTTPQGTVISNLQKDAPKDSSTLEVENQELYEVGQDVVIDPGKENEETNTIIAMGSLKLKNPLQHSHSRTAVVAGLPTGTTTPAATQTMTPAAKYAAGAATHVAGVPNPMLIVGLFLSAGIIAIVFRLAQSRTRQSYSYAQCRQTDFAPENEAELENARECSQLLLTRKFSL